MYGPNEELQGPHCLRVATRLTWQETHALWLSGEVERVLIVKGRVKPKFIFRFTPKSWKLRDRSCTMGPKVMESLVDDLWAGRPCMMSPISHGPNTL